MVVSMRFLTLMFVVALSSGGCSHYRSSLCQRVYQIRSIPMKGKGHDKVYLDLLEAGDSVIPCLISKISDTSPMEDPRMAPRYSGMVVGDVAVFVLVRKTQIGFSEFLPQDVKDEYRTRGVYAYFDYVADPSHRSELQSRWREWWRKRKSRN